MDIRLLYSDGCPNWRKAREHLGEALRELGWSEAVHIVAVETEEQAQAMHFTGSPTITVDGQDIIDPGTGTPGLACRIYRTQDGPSGAPTTAQIVGALKALDRGRSGPGTGT